MSRPSLRLAFDLGTNSIGWAVYELDGPAASRPSVSDLLDCGVRLFDDSRNPKNKRSLAEMRRVPRAARRRRDRYLMRCQELMRRLIDLGLMPSDKRARRALTDLDPYELRARGLDEALTVHELGRALFHLNQRRGFKSNRKTDRNDADKGKIAEAALRLREKLQEENARTYGEFLWRRHGGPDGKTPVRKRASVRIRMEGEGASALYEFYPIRDMLEAEFDTLISAQRPHHPTILSEEAVAGLRHAIFHQRPLKPVKRGRCTLEPDEERMLRAMPSVEARIIFETLNHLRHGTGLSLTGRLDKQTRDLVAATLLQGRNMSFVKLRATLKLPEGTRFSLQEQGKKDFKDFASDAAKALARKDRFGTRWHQFSLTEKDEIVARLIEEENDDELVAWLMVEHGLEQAAAEKVASWSPRDGTTRLGPTANAAVLAELEADICTYSEAVRRAGEKLGRPWHHSDFRDGVIELPLPYYGQILERHVGFGSGNPDDDDEKRYGRLPNPTVHRALGQLRRLVNKLIRKHGEPAQIVIELARDLKIGEKQKKEIQNRNQQNRRENDRRREELAKHGQIDNYQNRLRLRLYEEQQRANGGVALCPFTLEPISLEKLFSSAVEIEHILPYSRTLDDSPANKIVCYREANRAKRDRSPDEWLGQSERWPEIAAAAQDLPANKRWRFAPDAMERFENTERDFLARQINETRHLSKLARTYLGAACGFDQVYVTTGQLTAMLRARWGLNGVLGDDNKKVRNDHRHHAIDAITIGAIDRRLLQEIARRAGLAEIEGRDRITADVPEPFEGFLEKARSKALAVIVSLKPEHGKAGALHEDTAYGMITDEAERAEIGNLVYRKPLVDLTVGEIDRVRDPRLRAELREIAGPYRNSKGQIRDKEAAKELAERLEAFSRERAPGRMQGVRRIRIGKEKTGEVHIRDRRNGRVYKALLPGDNHHIDIVQMPDGTWQGFAATVFDVNQKGWRPEWERQKLGGKLVMRLHKGDTIEVEHEGRRKVMVVHRLEISANRVRLAPHHEGGELQKRHDDKDFRWDLANIGELKARGACQIRVDEAGRVCSVRSNVS